MNALHYEQIPEEALEAGLEHERDMHRKTLEHTRATFENARLALCRLGPLPSAHPTLEDAIRGVTEIMVALRADLANPPVDVQELALTNLGLMDGTCQLARDKAGHITITAATDVFPCAREAIQPLLNTHNAAVDLKQAKGRHNTQVAAQALYDTLP